MLYTVRFSALVSIPPLKLGSLLGSMGGLVPNLLRLQWALIVRLVLRVNWWRVLEEVEVSSVARDDSERLM